MNMRLWVYLLIAVAGAAVLIIWWGSMGEQQPGPIGGERESHGCLTSAGYAYDEEVGACIRAFEMTDDIKAAAALAVEHVGEGYALTVVSFNSYEERGSYDIMLERGEERSKAVVYIRGGEVVEVFESAEGAPGN